MSEQKHTPGFWAYGVRPDGSIWISLGNPVTGPHRQGDFPGTEADARLSVAAPDLLSIAERLIRWNEKYGGEMAGARELDSIADAASKAVARATGKEGA